MANDALFRFATRERNAILLYNGRYNEQHDFVALEVVEGQLRFSFSLGSEVSRVTVKVQTGVSDGNWHQVRIDYFNRVRHADRVKALYNVNGLC